MLTVSDVQALIVITLGDAFVLNRRVRQHLPAVGAAPERAVLALDRIGQFPQPSSLASRGCRRS